MKKRINLGFKKLLVTLVLVLTMTSFTAPAQAWEGVYLPLLKQSGTGLVTFFNWTPYEIDVINKHSVNTPLNIHFIPGFVSKLGGTKSGAVPPMVQMSFDWIGTDAWVPRYKVNLSRDWAHCPQMELHFDVLGKEYPVHNLNSFEEFNMYMKAFGAVIKTAMDPASFGNYVEVAKQVMDIAKENSTNKFIYLPDGVRVRATGPGGGGLKQVGLNTDDVSTYLLTDSTIPEDEWVVAQMVAVHHSEGKESLDAVMVHFYRYGDYKTAVLRAGLSGWYPTNDKMTEPSTGNHQTTGKMGGVF